MSGCHVKYSNCALGKKKKMYGLLCVFRRGCECKCWPQYKDSRQSGTESFPAPLQPASPVLLTEGEAGGERNRST